MVQWIFDTVGVFATWPVAGWRVVERGTGDNGDAEDDGFNGEVCGGLRWRREEGRMELPGAHSLSRGDHVEVYDII